MPWPGIHVATVEMLVCSTTEDIVGHVPIYSLLQTDGNACQAETTGHNPPHYLVLLPQVQQHQSNDCEQHVETEVPCIAHATAINCVPRVNGIEKQKLAPPRVWAMGINICLESRSEGPKRMVWEHGSINHHDAATH